MTITVRRSTYMQIEWYTISLPQSKYESWELHAVHPGWDWLLESSLFGLPCHKRMFTASSAAHGKFILIQTW